MEFFQVLALAVLQGLTEFLPVSSSAHLILLTQIDGWTDQGLAFDVAVHVGTLAAVLGYFRRELLAMGRDWGASLESGRSVGDSGLAWAVMLGSIPVGLAGVLFNDTVQTALRSPLVIAWATIGFALLLWWADSRGRGTRSEHGIGWTDALVVGAAQALALIPGTSRSGVTMTAGLMLGLTRSAAARFSFLLSIPAIAMAGWLHLLELSTGAEPVDWDVLLLGCAVAGVTAYACIHVFLRLLERVGMLPFVVYRLVLGAVLLQLHS
jgi:undecaprenyl-diphosphatase